MKQKEMIVMSILVKSVSFDDYNGYAKKQKSCLKSQNTGKKNSFYPHKNADKKNTDC